MGGARVLVVGGAGYIGSHMVLALQDAGYDAVVFDNLSRGFANAVGTTRLIVGDLRSSDDIDACLRSGSFDLVMHFAALAYVGESVSDPESYYDNNVVGTFNLLRSMRRHGVDKLVFSSTCAIYGEPEFLPIDESHPKRPINPYGRSKLTAEMMLRDYAHAYNLHSVALRYFNAAGADAAGRAGERHNPETHLIPLALMAARSPTPESTSGELRVFGDDFPTPDGSCIRDYIHVTDLCEAHLLAARRLLSGKQVGADAFNLSNGNGFSVFEVIEACSAVTGQQIPVRVEKRRAGDPAALIGNAQRAARELGWQPRFTNLHDVIRTSWNWMNREDVPR